MGYQGLIELLTRLDNLISPSGYTFILLSIAVSQIGEHWSKGFVQQ